MSGTRVCAIAANPALDRIAVAPGAAAGGTVRASEYVDTAGGKAVHVAAAAAVLGADVELVTALGGERGELVARLLRERSIACRTVHIGAQTRGTYSLVDPAVGDLVEVIEPSPQLSADEARALDAAVEAAVARAGVVVASGSLPAGVDNGFYAMVTERARAAGAFAIIDAHGAALRRALAASPDLVKPNLAEACELIGEPLDADVPIAKILAAARTVQRAGARRTWISIGERGSLLLDVDGAAWIISLEAPSVVSAVGCGDAMVGGLAVGLTRGLPLLDAARLGVAAAVDKLSRADPGLVDAAGVAALLPSVQVERIADPTPGPATT